MTQTQPEATPKAKTKLNTQFVHLHGHSSFSILDSNAHIEDLVIKAKELENPALALTEHRTLASAIKFYTLCKKHEIKPILGIEQDEINDKSIKSKKLLKDEKSYHLILLAKNLQGWQNLISISSDACTEGLFNRKARTDIPFIKNNNLGKGVIALTACLGGRLSNLLNQGNFQGAKKWLQELKEIFDDVYVEIQAHEFEEQITTNTLSIKIAQETNTPLVITKDFHYVNPEDYKIHNAWVEVKKGGKAYDNNGFYMYTPEKIARYCKKYNIPKEAITNTLKISESIEEFSPIFPTQMPQFLPKEEQHQENNHLRFMAFDRLITLLKEKNPPEPAKYIERTEKELWVITRKNFAGYFLVLQDIIEEAKRQNIQIGPGRGSAAGSLIAYLLGITRIDPLEYDLMFERFLNPARNSIPDIDIDIEPEGRAPLIEYLKNKYGEENVAQVGTYGKLQTKSAIKDVLRGLGYTFQQSQYLSDMVPETYSDQKKLNLNQFLSLSDPENKQKVIERYGEEKALGYIEKSQKFKDELKKDPKIYEILSKVEGFIRAYGLHPAGVIVSPIPIKQYLPIRSKGNTGIANITQWDLEDAETAGGVKLDLLGLKNLRVIKECSDFIKETPEEIEIKSIKDTKNLELIATGKTHGCFQTAGGAVRDVGTKLKPSTFNEVIDLIALARPGPLDAKMSSGETIVEFYINRKNDGKLISTHPSIDPIMLQTKGTMIYQEQIMAIFQKIGDYSLAEADEIRRGIGKKKIEVLLELEKDFISRGLKRNYDPEFLRTLFEGIKKFAGYCFNLSHSAGYAIIAVTTGYLKYYYPTEFFTALLNADIKNNDLIRTHLLESKDLNIPILSPNINTSKRYFTIENGNIRYGLQGLKNLGKTTDQEIIAKQPFHSLEDFVTRTNGTKVNRTHTKILILSGAFDEFEENRFKLLNHFHFDIRKFKESDTLEKNDYAIRYNENLYNRNTKLELEQEHLGLYLSGHPADIYEQTNPKDFDPFKISTVCGKVIKKKEIKDKKGNPMAFITLDTPYGTTECVIFSHIYQNIPKSVTKENNILYITGKLDPKKPIIKVDSAITPSVFMIKPPELRSPEIQHEEKNFHDFSLQL